MISPANLRRAKLRSRALALSVALWLFGIATSIVLIGLWGRTVAVDQVTLEASTRAVLESEIVNDRVADWLGDAVAAAGRSRDGLRVGVVDDADLRTAVIGKVAHDVRGALRSDQRSHLPGSGSSTGQTANQPDSQVSVGTGHQNPSFSFRHQLWTSHGATTAGTWSLIRVRSRRSL